MVTGADSPVTIGNGHRSEGALRPIRTSIPTSVGRTAGAIAELGKSDSSDTILLGNELS
jgi:hypothetical protein